MKRKAAQNEKELEKLVGLLSQGKHLTVARIASRMRCTKSTVYNRIQALKKRRVSLSLQRIRESAKGQKAAAYAVARRRKA